MAKDDSKASGGNPGSPNGAPFAPLGICARCHRPLTRPGSAGGCLHCIVNFIALDEDAGLASAVADSEEVRRYSHFEIMLEADGALAELGAGSMGTTYRAQDTVLQSPVALKVIGRNVADSPTVRARFLREARSAARLRHPNVASVFHYGEQDGECFYVMELVEGETLEEHVRRQGPLSAQSVLEIGVQVARALEAAEAQGLVHRDLKPSNLMLVSGSSGEGKPSEPLFVKVIDFGLAKAVEGDGQPTGEHDTRHGFVGTPAYASPEQFAQHGATNRVDTRSDIYSLGVTLWYLLCGRPPFRGQTLEEIHGKQISRAAPIDQLMMRRVPAPVVALLRSMLAVDPNARPQSARELLEALKRCQGKDPRTLSRKLILVGVGVALLLVLGVLAAILLRGRAEQISKTQPLLNTIDRSVAVLPFENRSSDPSVAFFTGGVQDAVTGELARIAQLKVVTPTAADAATYHSDKRDLAKIGHELGVTHLVEGTVQRENDQLQITVKLTDIHDQALAWSKHYSGHLADVFAIQREITREIADRLRAALSPGEKAAINEPPTTDPVAYDLYLRATQGPHQFNESAAVRQGVGEQLALLDQAVARDPKFLPAYCVIAELHDEMADNMADATPEEKAVDHRTLTDVALEKARRINPDDGLLHLAQANHFLEVSQDTEQARIEVDLARRTLPNNAELEQTAGMIARSEGRWDDAVRCLEKARSLDPHELAILTPLSRLYRTLRRYKEADLASERVLALRTGRNGLYDRLLRATIPLEERADVAPLRAALAEADPDSAHTYLVVYWLIAAFCTRDSDAVSRILAQTPPDLEIEYQSVVYPRSWFEGIAARMRGDGDAARVAFAKARLQILPVVEAHPYDANTLSLLAEVDAGLGHKEDAVSEGQRANTIVSQRKQVQNAPIVGCRLAVVYAWTNEQDRAFALLDDLIGQPAGLSLLDVPTYGDFQLDPVWDPLRGDPRFAALLAKPALTPTH